LIELPAHFDPSLASGVHMKDLISLHVALSDTVEGGLINFRKMAQLSLIFQELQELQNATPPPGANVDLVNTLRVTPNFLRLYPKVELIRII
jgi:hypothetical protein